MLLFSFSLGLVAAFNPCGFPLLPAYLMLSAGEAASKPIAARIGRSLTAGLGMTVGFILVFGALGLAFDLGVAVTESWVPWVMIPVGAACAAYGIATCVGRIRGLRLPLPRMPRDRNTALTFSVFGIGFAVASLSCALPLFVAGVAAVFGRHGTVDGLASGLAYAVGMGLVVTCVSLAGAGARQVRLSRIRSVQPTNATINAPLPDFRLPYLENPKKTFGLSADLGHYVVINFWSSICTVCKTELPNIEAAYKKTGKWVDFVGVDLTDEKGPAEALAKKAGLTYPLVSDNDGVAAASGQITGLPYTLIIGPHGGVQVRHPGNFTAEQLTYILQMLDRSVPDN